MRVAACGLFGLSHPLRQAVLERLRSATVPEFLLSPRSVLLKSRSVLKKFFTLVNGCGNNDGT
ncbi:hypothetical protein D516_1718 [Rhodobacter sp. AKP1]|nr:hypothetical protein D516_1718 [Rhodobacter sp. AKP1]